MHKTFTISSQPKSQNGQGRAHEVPSLAEELLLSVDGHWEMEVDGHCGVESQFSTGMSSLRDYPDSSR